jgi:PucR family transcriptional regulator, purine catabolism regulatory protein
MPLPLRQVLDHPCLAAADPLVLAGEDHLSRPVTWVHTSEVLHVADLLRGGELLLIGGLALEEADEHERRRYVRSLMDRSVAGLAIETGPRFPVVPPEMIEEASRLGLPLIELRRVVRFVDVSQSVNGQLIHESIRRVQLADQISHALAGALAAGADLADLLKVLSAQTAADIDLLSLTGQVIVSAEAPGGEAEPASQDDSVRGTTITVPVAMSGVTVALLALRPRPNADLVLLDVAQERAPEVFALALMRTRPPSQFERDVRDLLTMIANVSPATNRYRDLVTRVGFATAGPYVTVVARFDGLPTTAPIEAALRRHHRRTLSQVHQGRYLAVVGLGGTTLSRGRDEVLGDLKSTALPPGTRIAVGPGAGTPDLIIRCMGEAISTLDIPGNGSSAVIDSADLSVERLLLALDKPAVIDEFVEEQLGSLIRADRARGSELVTTLSAYIRHWGRKTDTAAALHLQRQSLYQRLERIFDLLGELPAGSPRLGGLLIAAEFEAARKHL